MSEVQIKCPECEAEFVVPEELVGFPVECGSCGHPFDLAEGHIIENLKRAYPGEKPGDLSSFNKKTLDPEINRELGFQTVKYDNSVTADDVMPGNVFGKVLVALGMAILLGISVYFISQHRSISYGALTQEKLWLLSGFFSLLGSCLILFGVRRFHAVDYVIAVTIGGVTCSLPLWFPYDGPEVVKPDQLELLEEVSKELETIEDEQTQLYKQSLGYDVVANQLREANTPEEVVAIALLGAKPVHVDVIRKYLGNVVHSESVPRTYKNRTVNGMPATLLVYSDSKTSLKDVVASVAKFGKVVDVREELRVIDVLVNESALTMSDSHILVDDQHPNFHAVNLRELKHIDPERQEAAVHRFIDVSRLRLRADVNQQLLTMLQDPYCEIKEDVVEALKRWDDPKSGVRGEIAKQAREFAVQQKAIPKSYLEFLVEQDVKIIGDIIVYAWMNDRISNESLLLSAGSRAENALLEVFDDLDPSAKRSASIVLRKVGTERSLDVLIPVYQSAEGDLKNSLKATIDEIQSRR